MTTLYRCAAALIVLCAVPAPVRADAVRLTEGLFAIGRPLIGTERAAVGLVWLNPPETIFGPAAPGVIDQSWQPFEVYASTLLGTNEPVLPLPPGPVTTGGTFTADGLSLQFSGGTVTVPSVFPPTDSEDLYTLTAPFVMTGHWTIDVPTGTGTVRFDRDIVASGYVNVLLGAERATGNSIISQVNYFFEEAVPAPEPATLLLLGIAGAGLLARGRVTRGIRG